jgi:hypothetical protein
MFEKIAMLFIGLVLILMGIQAIFESGYWSASWNRYIDYGQLHSVIGVILIVWRPGVYLHGDKIIN